ncbi:MAG: DNA ligase-associated DEXH box helicase [Geminicoccus sp.]|nr:DNA ligase-associated DEXH box helicase [Geminicoccus sp.]
MGTDVGLPPTFTRWFEARGWAPHAHQLAMLEAAQAGQSALLTAPTGGGKTLAGFLPSLVELAGQPDFEGLHTLYISPLKALVTDIRRNLETPLGEMGLAITAEARTGDTPANRRARQRERPPHILMTTPESLALLLSYEDSDAFFGNLRCVILDELHALATNKRGHLLSLGVARLQSLAPDHRRLGLSATVADPQYLLDWLHPDAGAVPKAGAGVAEDGHEGAAAAGAARVVHVRGRAGARPDIRILTPEDHIHMPWSGHMAVHAMEGVYRLIRDAGMSIVFVNTRAQAELCFAELWRLNEDGLAIAMHHGSLEREQRRKVEAAMAAGTLQSVVATSSLDLGIDWGSVDLVVQVGAPKGVSRLMQRIGRANHRFDEPSRAVLVPANRFEVLECQACMDGVWAEELDGDPARPGGLDVLAQHIIGMACAWPFQPDDLYAEVIRARPFRNLSRQDFDDTLGFVTDGGYALRAYERYQRLLTLRDGRRGIADGHHARRYRMNIGTIVEAPTLKVRLGNGFRRALGEVEEFFANGLRPGDTFIFAGRLLEFIKIDETSLICRAAHKSVRDPAVPAYGGGRMPLTANLADRVRVMLEDPSGWARLPDPVSEWLQLQAAKSRLPSADRLLVETFPRGERMYLVAYCFEGRNAHQTLGMLLTKRLERFGYAPLGFVASDYCIATWSLRVPETAEAVAELFDQDMLGDDLEAWMDESTLLKRTFRRCAVIGGLIDQNVMGPNRTRRQVTFNNDIIYDVLRRHEPGHVLLRATRQDAAGGLTDVSRLADMLVRFQDRIEHVHLPRVSPMAVPVMLDIGKEGVASASSAMDELLDISAAALIGEAIGDEKDGGSDAEGVDLGAMDLDAMARLLEGR